MFNKKYLIITAHPDDLESPCGGLVSKIIAEKGSVTNLILVKPSTEQNPKRNANTVRSELEQSKKVLKFKTVIYDTPLHSNGRPNLTVSNNLVSFVESVASDHDILISHNKEDYHNDHKTCYEIAQSVARKDFEQFWLLDQYPYNLHYKKFCPNLYVDITDHVEQKKKALSCYASYFTNISINNILTYNQYRGSFINKDNTKTFAETFKIVYSKV